MNSQLLIQVISTGILLGGLYAIMSIGISLSWGSLKIINLAHFSFVLFGAYIAYQVTLSTGVDPLVTALVVVPVLGIASGLMQWFFEKVKVDEFQSLIISFGFFIIFQSLVRTLWTADFRSMGSEFNRYTTMSISIGFVSIQTALIITFVTSLLVAAGISALLTRTHFGRAVRATVQDPEVARAYGIDQRKVAVILAALAGGVSGLAGMFIAILFTIAPVISFGWFGIIFPVVILGGLGKAWGAVGAGVIIGVAAAIATVTWGPLSAPLVTFTILIVALLFKPEGVFTRKSTI